MGRGGFENASCCEQCRAQEGEISVSEFIFRLYENCRRGQPDPGSSAGPHEPGVPLAKSSGPLKPTVHSQRGGLSLT